MPVYKKNTTLNSDDRSDNILGWVYAAFRSGDLMQGIIQSRSAHLDNLTYMEIYDDKVSEDSLLYSSTNKGSKFSDSHKPLNSKEISMNIQGRKWILYIYEESNPDSKDSYLPWYIGIAGVIIDLLLFYVILSISSVQKRAVNLAKDIAGKIEEKNNELEVLNSELEANENRITAIVDNTVDGLITINSDYIVQSYNKACTKIFGYTNEEIIGHHIKMLMPEFFTRQQDDGFGNQLQTDQLKFLGSSHEVECLKKNGIHFFALLSISELLHKDEKIFIIAIKDITKQKNADAQIKQTLNELKVKTEELEKAKQDAITSSKSKSEFLANMSHEIRTPMTAILGYIDLLKENENIKFTEALEQVQIIEKNGDHLLTIINDILDLSKIEAGKLELEYAPFCLYEMTCNLQNLLEAKVKEKSISLNVEIGYPVPQKVSGDLTRIRQILLNLLGNAIKFTHKGSVTLHLKWNPQASELSFDIVDTGIGMTPEQCEKVFNSFEQADTSITRTFGGTGLGLSITKRLIEMMHGHVSVESEYGKGSKFSVMIKVKASTDKLINQPPQVKTQIELKKTNGLQGHILLVDDNMTNLTLIGKILKKMNLEVECCMNGEEATKILLNSDNDFDLVLMDVQMPVMDGLTAASILKQNSYNKPVIALTANNMKGDKEKCLEAGYCDFASKPINRKELYKMLCEYLTPPE
ncbi:MAG: ATP-binding protein, partial [Lentisphaeraceae bacterium]|nr:ATP-binding protein [Lentisphaeraceae bacterium]